MKDDIRGSFHFPQSHQQRKGSAMRRRFLGMVALAVLLAACSSSPGTNAAKPTGFAALTGKRLSGTSSSWLAIASPAAHPVDVAGTSTPPVITDNESAFQSVTFFDFPTSAAAATFYSNPPLASVLTSSPLQVLSRG